MAEYISLSSFDSIPLSDIDPKEPAYTTIKCLVCELNVSTYKDTNSNRQYALHYTRDGWLCLTSNTTVKSYTDGF